MGKGGKGKKNRKRGKKNKPSFVVGKKREAWPEGTRLKLKKEEEGGPGPNLKKRLTMGKKMIE